MHPSQSQLRFRSFLSVNARFHLMLLVGRDASPTDRRSSDDPEPVAAAGAAVGSVAVLLIATFFVGCTSPGEPSKSDANLIGTHRRITTVDCDHGAAIVTYGELIRSNGEFIDHDRTRWEVLDRNVVDYLRTKVLTFDNVG